MGIEPTCPAWKAGVLTIVLHPRVNIVFHNKGIVPCLLAIVNTLAQFLNNPGACLTSSKAFCSQEARLPRCRQAALPVRFYISSEPPQIPSFLSLDPWLWTMHKCAPPKPLRYPYYQDRTPKRSRSPPPGGHASGIQRAGKEVLHKALRSTCPNPCNACPASLPT